MMGDPKLYGWYDRHEAIGLFGSEAEARCRCDGQWVVFPDVVLCLADVGEPTRASHFTNGGQFCWVADKPYRVHDDEHVRFVPPEVIARHADRPIRLFVRPPGTERYRYVGELGPACKFTISGGGGNCGEAYLELSPALPSEVWGELGGPRPGDLDHDALDAALGRLRHPANVEERLWVLRRLVEYWHGPIRPEDGIPEAELEGLTIPYPLRWWYRRAGRRTEILSGQNRLKPPDGLSRADGKLLFYVENQGCYHWGTEPEGDDPPVFGREDDSDPWEAEGVSLSEHLILACLFEAILCHSPYGAAAAWLEESVLDRIIEHVSPIPVGPWRWIGPTRFHAGGGAFLYTMPNGEMGGRRGYSVWIGAKTEHPLQFLKPYIDEGWEYVAV